jgi:hypothetical protein
MVKVCARNTSCIEGKSVAVLCFVSRKGIYRFMIDSHTEMESGSHITRSGCNKRYQSIVSALFACAHRNDRGQLDPQRGLYFPMRSYLRLASRRRRREIISLTPKPIAKPNASTSNKSNMGKPTHFLAPSVQ